MKACIYREFGKESVLEWVDNWPTPICNADSLLIEVVASSINPKDGFLRRGKFSRTLARDPLPRLTGLDLSGTVIEVGANVSHFRIGDAVFGMTNNFSGGVLGSYAVLKESEVAKAPNSISLSTAASIPLAAQTALQALRNICGITPASKVLITGASGGVGHFAIQIAKQLGAHVHGACSSGNIDFVTSIGGDRVFDYKKHNLFEIDEQYDAIFDSAGRYQRSDFSKQLGKSGTFVSTVPTSKTLLMELISRLGVSNRERLVAVQSERSDLEQLAQWIDDKKISPHIQEFYDPAKIAAAHTQIQSGHTRGKIVVTLAAS